VLCDEHGIGGDGEYCGDDNDAQLGCINVFYYEASGGKYALRAVFFDLEPGVISAVRLSPLGEHLRPRNFVNHTRGQKLAKGHYSSANTNSSDPPLKKRQAPIRPPPPCSLAALVVNSEPHTGARPSVRLCAGPELARCVHQKEANT
jgi:hypothetical protein